MTHKTDNTYYRDVIRQITKPLEFVDQFANGQGIRWLSNEINSGKKKLKHNSVDFIVAGLLDKKDRLVDYSKKDFINLYVIGTFRNDFIPTLKVAEALAIFYMEMRVLPNLINITKKDILEDKYQLDKIRNGILIYDRERSLH